MNKLTVGMVAKMPENELRRQLNKLKNQLADNWHVDHGLRPLVSCDCINQAIDHIASLPVRGLEKKEITKLLDLLIPTHISTREAAVELINSIAEIFISYYESGSLFVDQAKGEG